MDSESAGGEAELVAFGPEGRQPGDSPAPQGLSITLADRNYTVSGADPHAHYRVQAGSLNLVLDVTIGSSYNLTLVWNKHMSVSIKITRAAQVARAPPRPPGGGWQVRA
ncbi:mucin-6 [Pteropus medius]|uniref:mucin-6 n=1 Tax=Pteropus vampyrus TaxID=132908 RepID=UPI00196B53EA|nr:mucin-6 [Pteropus giganteus]